MVHLTQSSCRRLVTAAVVALIVAAAAPARAQHRARLSADLADHLAAGSPSIDLIVDGTRAETEALAARYNLRIKKHLKSGAVFTVSAGELAALQQDDAVDHLSADIRYRAAGDITAETIGADQVWAGSESFQPLTGKGVGVAVIDSGVDSSHAALRGRVIANVDFTGGNGVDRFGHGTHVAAIIAGQAGRLVETSDYRGIASGALIVNLRVLGADGSGLASNVIEAIDWAVENRKAFNIKVINLSLGAPVTQPYRDDPVCEAVERAVAAGIHVVAAAGNYGQSKDGRVVYGGITSPGNDPNAITVGAVDVHGTAVRSDDTVAKYSSRGPTMYDLVLKPDLVAPGSRVVSAEAAGSYLAGMFPERHVAGAGADGYMQLSGTSMAAGVVSGAVALLLEQTPKLTPRDAKATLQLTSSFMAGEGLLASGAGSLNVLAAVEFVDAAPKESSPVTEIAGEPVRRSGISFFDSTVFAQQSVTIGRKHPIRGTGLTGSVLVWDTPSNDTVIRSTGETIIWGQQSKDTIIWGQSGNDTIIWGQDTGDTIIWGQNTGDTIIWGQNTADTIIWGQITGDTIIWGQNTADTIIWGQDLADTIIWGQTEGDTIIWGQNSVGALD
jgi:serine protease AprX